MKKLLLLAFCACSAFADDPLNNLIDALIQVESGGEVFAIGDGGKAFGILQIHEIMIDDFNRISDLKGLGVKYKHSDAFSEAISKKICRVVLSYYGMKVIEQKGYITYEDMARIWNGGPQGWKDYSISKPLKERNLENYWRKVQKFL